MVCVCLLIQSFLFVLSLRYWDYRLVFLKSDSSFSKINVIQTIEAGTLAMHVCKPFDIDFVTKDCVFEKSTIILSTHKIN